MNEAEVIRFVETLFPGEEDKASKTLDAALRLPTSCGPALAASSRT